MKGSKIVKIVMIAVVLAALVLGYYFYLGHKTRKQEAEKIYFRHLMNSLFLFLIDVFPI